MEASQAGMKHLDVEKYAGARQNELAALIDAVEKSGAQFGLAANARHLRRRTNAYKRYNIGTRRPNSKKRALSLHAEEESGDPKVQAFTNRRMRRKPSQLLAKLTRPRSEGPKYLPTHIWHAKRMHMVTRWGCVVAGGATGKGSGSRSLLKKLRTGSVMHDASYHGVLQMSGSLRAIIELLMQLGDKSKIGHLRSDKAFTAGAKDAELMLHHKGSFPNDAIAPVSMLLDPCPQTEGQKPEPEEGRQAWMWCHPSAAGEAETALKSAGQDLGVSFANRSDHVGQIRLWGSKADAAVCSALSLDFKVEQQESCAPVCSSHRAFSACQNAANPSEAFGEIADSMPFHLRIKDPRAAKPFQEAFQSSGSAGKPGPSLMEVAYSESWPEPLSEQALSKLRHDARRGMLFMSEDIENEPAGLLDLSACPFIAIRSGQKGSQPQSWRLVCPQSWLMPIWVALAYAGATPVGQRELQWIDLDHGRPQFPEGFPDTQAAKNCSLELLERDEAHRTKRPRGMYPDFPKVDWQIVGQGPGQGQSDGGAEAHADSRCLLPDGCYIARSRRVLHKALPQIFRQASTQLPAKRSHQEDSKFQPVVGSASTEGASPTNEKSPVKPTTGLEEPKQQMCFVYATLQFFPSPGTAESGAAVYSSDVISLAKPEEEKGSFNQREADNANEISHRGLNLSKQRLSKPAPHQRGQTLQGNILLGYAVAGEVRGPSGQVQAIAVLRADLLTSFEGKSLEYKVLVQNPRSHVAHLAKAKLCF